MSLKLYPTLLAIMMLAGPALADTNSGEVSVTLIVDHLPDRADRTCPVTVSTTADAGDILDAAVASGCISAWAFEGTRGEGYGRYVTSIEGADPLAFGWGTFWKFQIDGADSPAGIDYYQPTEGATVGFVHAISAVTLVEGSV